MSKIIKLILFLPLLLIVPGCSMFSPVKTEPRATYVLNAHPQVQKKYTRHITLLVNKVDVDPIYDTSDMAYSTDPYQIEYFAKSQWLESPGKMLLPLIMQTMKETHHFHAVISLPASSQFNYILNTHIVELRQIFYPCASVLKFTLNAEIINASNRQVIAAKQFTVIQPVYQRDPRGGVIAANEAVSKVLRALVRFCLRTI